MIQYSFFINKLKSFVEQNRQMIFFVVRVVIIYSFWKFLVWLLGEEKVHIEDRIIPWLSNGWEIFNSWIRVVLLYASKFVFDAMGYNSEIINNYRLYVHEMAYVGVGNYCLGIQLWLFFVTLICSYPGNWKRKMIISFIGVMLINVLNVLRIVLLVFAVKHYPENIQFNHDYVFNISVYILTFLIWRYIIKHDLLESKKKLL